MQDIQTKFNTQTERYRQNFQKYGYSEKSMFMPSDRRVVRYYELLKNFDFFQKADFQTSDVFCDAGCGFGDLNHYLGLLGMEKYSYLGLDVVEEFMEEGRKRYGREGIAYVKRNFITDDISDLEFDYAVSSQTFTIQYTEKNENYDVIYAAVSKLFRQCRKGVSFNFFTDQGEFQRSGTAYHNPARLLEFAYSLSKNVILDNSCFPYECTLTILKNNSVEENGMIFDRFMELHRREFDNGTFCVKSKDNKNESLFH